LKNIDSAKVSMPTKVVEVKDDGGNIFYQWKVDLLKSEQYWMNWFKGLTNSFLSIKVPKILMLAEKERMDKDLTIAQMQGKFRVVVLHNVGHYM
jgi:protein phosphatase methylesterase 1